MDFENEFTEIYNDKGNLFFRSIADLKHKKVIFWGTGRFAEKFHKKYCIEKNLIAEPMFFCDNNAARQGTSFLGKEIISPEKTKLLLQHEQQDYAVIICACATNGIQILAQLEFMGIGMFPIYLSTQLEAYFYFSAEQKKLFSVINFFEDEKSKKTYTRLLLNMIKGHPVSFDILEPNQYFPNDIIKSFNNGEILVDAGVCHGEEIDRALRLNKNIKIYAFEPNRESIMNLKTKYMNTEQVVLYENALWEKTESLSFTKDTAVGGERIASEVEENSFCVKAIALDKLMAEEKITFVKMDIEGAEMQALLGMERIIHKHKPKLAIAVYHKIEDYLEIPLLVKQLNPKYKFYFKQHSYSSAESILYCI